MNIQKASTTVPVTSGVIPSKATVRTTRRLSQALRLLAGGLLGFASLVAAPLTSAAQAQADQLPAAAPAPTVRYARGEEVDLAEIIAEWRGYYEDVPIYLCVCQEDTCNQTAQWPYREYNLYEMGVALGPNNGKIAEDSGASCVDIADGSSPSEPRTFSAAETTPTETTSAAAPPPQPTAPSRPTPNINSRNSEPGEPAPRTPALATPAASSPATNDATLAAAGPVPQATAINDGADIRLEWPGGSSNVINVADSTWNINVLDALDCSNLSQVEAKTLVAQRVVGQPAVDATTGHVAVPVLLDTCVESDQSAVFVLDPSEGGGYALYRTQLPGERGLPNEFSSYAFRTILDVNYWNGALLVRQGTASDATSISIFRPGRTPAGEYAGCGVMTVGEGAGLLCEE